MRVRLFAGLRQAMGWSELLLYAAPGATPLGIWQQLALGEGWRGVGGGAVGGESTGVGGGTGAEGDGAGLPAEIRVAINQRFAEAHTPLADGDELAFLPPISGG